MGDGCAECNSGLIRYSKSPEITNAGIWIFKGFTWLKNYKMLPEPGPWPQQTAKFIKGVEFCDSVISLMDKARARANKEMEMKHKLMSRLNKM